MVAHGLLGRQQAGQGKEKKEMEKLLKEDDRDELEGGAAAKVVDIRAESRAAALQAAAARSSGEGHMGAASPRKSMVSTLTGSSHHQPPPPAPILEGMSVSELVMAHHDEEVGDQSLADTLALSLDDPAGAGATSSLSQRLRQISCGYQLLAQRGPEAARGEPIHGSPYPGRTQLEAPLQHDQTWALLPVRKALLTKRSRRCLLSRRGEVGEGAGLFREATPCKGIVVKPQINPCSNPPFQKNNAAVHFVPRIVPFSCEIGAEGGSSVITFSMANPVDSEMKVVVDPTAFNAGAGSEAPCGLSPSRRSELSAEQTVRVLTKPFQTAIGRFNELADVGADFGEDTESMKALKQQDDLDVIPERHLYKVLVRVRFEVIEPDRPWAFYCTLSLSFADPEGRRHSVDLVLRFGAPQPGRGSAAPRTAWCT